jgi:hypothetical protein
VRSHEVDIEADEEPEEIDLWRYGAVASVIFETRRARSVTDSGREDPIGREAPSGIGEDIGSDDKVGVSVDSDSAVSSPESGVPGTGESRSCIHKGGKSVIVE